MEEKLVRVAPVMELVVQGQVITTTAEHPFYVAGQERFIPAGDLTLDDRLIDSQGRSVAMDAIRVTDRLITVYNLRVADFHTYFVGGKLWQFEAWVHNAGEIYDLSGIAPSSGGTKRVTQFFDPKKGDFPIDGRYALSSQPTAGNRLMDGITETTTYVAPRPASEMNMFRRMMTGVGTRRNYVEFDVLPNELIAPSGSKRLYGAWQQTISGQVDLMGRNAVYGVKGTNYLDYGFRYIVIPGGILGGGYAGYQFLNSENK